jgi:anti-sigma factor RsiW
MNAQNKIPMTFDANMYDANMKNDTNMKKPLLAVDIPVNRGDELDWLMSLALDDALATDEAARFDWLLLQAPEHEARWEQWQMVDSDFHHMPAALPPTDFAEKFALRLQIQERQRRLRTGFIFGLAAVALWGSALVGVVMLGALAWSNQGAWLAELVQNTAYWWAAMGQFARALVNTAQALWEAPQTRTILACYIVAAVAILASWFAFLRRSTHELPLGEAQLVEA